MVDVEKIERRTVRSFYDDGLFEVAFGLIFLVLGAYFFAETALPAGSALRAALSALFVLVIISAGFIVNRVVRFLKVRITYPRTGYVAFKTKERSPRRRLASGITGALVGAGTAALLGLSPSARTHLPVINGLVLALVAFFVARKAGVVRLYALAAVSVIAGFAVTAAGVGDMRGVTVVYAVFGASLIVSGLAALVVYLRRSPRPEPETPEAPDAR